jgi:hypothetical protein
MRFLLFPLTGIRSRPLSSFQAPPALKISRKGGGRKGIKENERLETAGRAFVIGARDLQSSVFRSLQPLPCQGHRSKTQITERPLKVHLGFRTILHHGKDPLNPSKNVKKRQKPAESSGFFTMLKMLKQPAVLQLPSFRNFCFAAVL